MDAPSKVYRKPETDHDAVGSAREKRRELAKTSQFELKNFPGLRTVDDFVRYVVIRKGKAKEQFLTFQNSIIPKSLLDLGARENKMATKIHKDILGYMGDKQMPFPALLAQDIVRLGFENASIRDEIYAQLIKQLSSNPRPESELNGWKLICLSVRTFSPSEEFANYLLHFIITKRDHGRGAVVDYARYSLRALEEMNGENGFVPSVEDILAYKVRPPILATIYLVDGSVVVDNLPITPNLNVGNILHMCVDWLDLEDPRVDTLGIFVYDLGESETLSDTGNAMPYRDLPRTPRPLRSEDFMGDIIIQRARQKRLFKFVLKKKIFVPLHNFSETDPYYERLVFLQAEDEALIQGNIEIHNEEAAVSLAGISMAIALGDNMGATVDELVANDVSAFIAPSWRQKNSAEVWALQILQHRHALVNSAVESLQEQFLEIVRGCDLYGMHFFHVYKVEFPSSVTAPDIMRQLPRELTIGINYEGLHIYDNRKVHLVSFPFAGIFRWGGSSAQFSLIMAHASLSFEFVILTAQAADMASIILDHIRYNMKLEDDISEGNVKLPNTAKTIANETAKAASTVSTYSTRVDEGSNSDLMKSTLCSENKVEDHLKRQEEHQRVERESLCRERIEQEMVDTVAAQLEENLRLENERREHEFADRERAEQQRVEQERLQRERMEKEIADLVAAEAAHKLRLEQERERAEQERVEKEIADLLAAEAAHKLRLENERREQEFADRERAEQQRVEQERLQRERMEKEIADLVAAEAGHKMRLEQERARAEQQRVEQERLQHERTEKEIADRVAAEVAHKLRLENERREQEFADRERAEQQRVEQERLQRERMEKEIADRVAAEVTNKLRLENERREQEYAERERAEQQRVEQERLQRERMEKEITDRVATEVAEKLRAEHLRLSVNTETNSSGSKCLVIPISELVLGEKLGEGGFGEVFIGTWAFQPVAVKRCKVALAEKEEKEIRAELETMYQLQHKNIVRLFGLVSEPRTPHMIVMEYGARGSLYSLLQSTDELNWGMRVRIAEEMTSGLAYLHMKNVIHRDIKSMNVILDEDLHAKWCDFGLAVLKITSASSASFRGQQAGTPNWMAPELFQGREAIFSVKSDIWALGMVFFELASKKLPYEGMLPMQMMFMIAQGNAEVVPEDCKSRMPLFAGLMERCWHKERSERPTAAVVLQELTRIRQVYLQTNTKVAGATAAPATRLPLNSVRRGRIGSDLQTIGCVTFANVLRFDDDFIPDISCYEYLQAVLRDVMPQVNTAILAEDCLQIAQKVLQTLPVDVPRLTIDEAIAVVAYTYNFEPTIGASVEENCNMYCALNQLLRERNPQTMLRLRPYMCYLMRGLSKLPVYDGIVYRGIPSEALATIQANYRRGHTIYWSGLTSTTTDLNVAKSEDFAGGVGGIVFQITVHSGRHLAAYTQFPDEAEVLLSPNAKFIVSSSCLHLPDGYHLVELVEQADASFVF